MELSSSITFINLFVFVTSVYSNYAREPFLKVESIRMKNFGITKNNFLVLFLTVLIKMSKLIKAGISIAQSTYFLC